MTYAPRANSTLSGKVRKNNKVTNTSTGLTRLVNATRYSLQGLKAAWINEAAFRLELMLLVILLPLALLLGNTAIERTLLIGSLFIVLIVELLNSAIEAAIDRFGEEQHELSGRAKDIASAAVFIALIQVLVVWLLILIN